MEVDNSYKGLQIHDLLLECANHAREVGDVSEEIISFAKSDAAPDAPVLSDLLLDTLFLYDSGVSCEDEDTLAAQRGHLGQLISKLIAGQCIVEQDAYERLDAPLLYAAGLIPDAKAFEKKHVRINTNLLYKQQKFNLFREDNEGYSKLVVELEAFLQTTKNAADDDRAQLLLTNIKSLIGYFDLDPNRVLDVLIELVALHLLSHWRFLIPALKLSPWFLNDGQIAKGEDTSRGDLDKRYGNRAAAQIIGFKFQQVKNLEDESQELTMLAALLVKEGLLKLQDLWPHLSPEDSILSKEKSAYQDRVLDQVDKAKGRNALAMSGGLDDEDSPSASMTQAQAMEIDEIKPTRKDNQQKIALLYALLNIGALPEALFVLSEFSFLLSSHPHLAEAYDKLLEHMIEPLWTQLRPQQKYPDDVKNNLQQLKRIPEELKYRDSALILPLPAKTVYVLDPRCNTRDAHLHEIFFYDQIDSQLTFCDNYATFEAQVLPLIRLAGVQIHRNVKLFAKIAKLGKSAILASADPEGTRQVWQAVLRSSMIPALSLLDTNPAIVNDIFNLISEYSTEQRYSMYGEWFTDSYKKIPELKVQFVKTEKETKSLLRRISKTNTKEYGRRLAKTSHSNPCIVLNIALNQIESYDNLVDVVIEASRYFTLLTFDVLVFVMLTLLSNTQKRRLKEDGTSVAHWLQSLSSFTAKIFRRYSHMDPSPIAVYVAKQLKMNNAFDLIILRDLINEMAGLRPTSDLSEEQLQGCAGGPYLRIEALLLINERRDPSAKAPMRLLHALDKAKLSFALPILIGQQRTQCVYNVPEEQSLLKLLANLADEVHQILIQYLEFLTLNTTVEHYTNSIPSISELVHTNGLEPCVAFMIARPAISAALQDHFKNIAPKNEQSPSFRESDESLPATKEAQDSDMNKSVTNEENVPETAMDVTSTDAMQIDPPIGVDVSKSLSYSLPLILTTLSGSIETFLPASVWSCMSSALYTTFWSFSLYDLVVPSERYEKEISKIKVELDQIKGDEANAQIHKVQLKQLTALQEEHVAQKHNARMVTTMFELEHSNWLGKSSKNDETALDRRNSGSVQAFLQHCLLPRCLISPNDATYCAEFLVKLQNVQMQGLDLMLLYASLFGPHLATSIFCCTEREAENLGRFLGKALERLNEMTTDEAAFNSLHPRPEPDVLQDNEKASSKDTSPWSRYKTLWYDSFHRGIWSSIKACFESREYMHIRNTMIVLERMQNAFPLFKWIGKNIEKEVDKIISTERREDLKIRALGYKAVLKRQQPKWLDPPGKPTVQKSSTAIESQQSQELPTVKSPPVISSSAASDDAKTVGPAPQAASNPEVASLDPILSAQTLETRVPERTGADMTSSSISLEQQKEKAKQKAASLSQHLKEQAQTAVRVKTENDNSQKGADKPDAVQTSDSQTRARGPMSRSVSRAASPRRSERGTHDESQSRGGERQDRTRANNNGGDPNEREAISRNPRSRVSSDRNMRDETVSQTRRSNNERSIQLSNDEHGRVGETLRRTNAEDYGRLSSDRYANEDRRRAIRGQDSRTSYDAPRTIRAASHDVPSGPRSDSLKDRIGVQSTLKEPLPRNTRTESSYERNADRESDRNGNSRKDRLSNDTADRVPDSVARPGRKDQLGPGDTARRDAPDGPRHETANIRASREISKTESTQAEAPGPFVHPDRLSSSSASATTQERIPSGAKKLGDRPHRVEDRAAVVADSAVHPSRIGIVQSNQTDRGREDISHLSRSNSNASRNHHGSGGNLRQSSFSGPDNNASGRDGLNRVNQRDSRALQASRDDGYRPQRDARASGRDIRVGSRNDARPPEISENRNDRADRDQDRGDTSRGRLQPERVPRNEGETKRRFTGDQRDQRAHKRR